MDHNCVLRSETAIVSPRRSLVHADAADVTVGINPCSGGDGWRDRGQTSDAAVLPLHSLNASELSMTRSLVLDGPASSALAAAQCNLTHMLSSTAGAE